MKGISLSAAVLILTAAGASALAGCRTSEGAVRKSPEDLVKRGQYLVTIGICNDCHTPWKVDEKGVPGPDMTVTLSGHPTEAPDPGPVAEGSGDIVLGPTATAFRGDFGVSYAANLTPDDETGIGRWTEEQFVKGLRSGRHMGQKDGRPILPPMPWSAYGQMDDDDLRAIFAYLKSLPPVRNPVPAPKVAPEVMAEMAKGLE